MTDDTRRQRAEAIVQQDRGDTNPRVEFDPEDWALADAIDAFGRACAEEALAGQQEAVRELYRQIGQVRMVLQRPSQPTDEQRSQIQMLLKWEALAARIGWPIQQPAASTNAQE